MFFVFFAVKNFGVWVNPISKKIDSGGENAVLPCTHFLRDQRFRVPESRFSGGGGHGDGETTKRKPMLLSLTLGAPRLRNEQRALSWLKISVSGRYSVM